MRARRPLKALAALALLAGTMSFFGCSKAPPEGQRAGDLPVDTAFQKKLQAQLLDAKPGSVIEIPAGSYHLDRGLSLRASGVTVRGAGMDKTILSFRGQLSGPEGLMVQASDFTIEHLTIEDSQGDGLKVNDGENITIRGVRVRWTHHQSTLAG